MSVLDFLWNAGQDGQISTLEEKVETLTKRVQILEDWIRYYGECETRKPNQESSVVETPTRLETDLLEVGTSSTKARGEE